MESGDWGLPVEVCSSYVKSYHVIGLKTSDSLGDYRSLFREILRVIRFKGSASKSMDSYVHLTHGLKSSFDIPTFTKYY